MSEGARFSVPLLHCFHDAYENRDARREKVNSRTESGDDGDGAIEANDDENVLSAAARMRRRGLTEAQLRQAVVDSLSEIVNTIDLQSALDIDGLEYAARSIVNYGIYDLTHLTSEDSGIDMIEQNVTAALTSYEPRIRPETLDVRRDLQFNDTTQKLRLSIYAEISHHPMDVPVEFIAEVDMSLGKVKIGSSSALS